MNFLHCIAPSVEIQRLNGAKRLIPLDLLNALMCEIMFNDAPDMTLSRDTDAGDWHLTTEEGDYDPVPEYTGDLRLSAQLLQWATQPGNCHACHWVFLQDELEGLREFWWAPAFPLLVVCAFGRVFKPDLGWNSENFGLRQVEAVGAFGILLGERNVYVPYNQNRLLVEARD